MRDLKRLRYSVEMHLLNSVEMHLLIPLSIDILSGTRNRASEEEIADKQPVLIAQRALTHWNTYLDEGDVESRDSFLEQAGLMLGHETYFANEVGGWPVPFVQFADSSPHYVLSALVQSYGVSVLIRAYCLTQDEAFMQGARCAVRAFELDILDGGVSAPIGEDGFFFEGIAVYPAQHELGSHILALFALYDYVAVTGDSAIEAVIQRGLTTLEAVVEEFDAKYWTYRDLISRHLTSRPYHSLSILLLERLAACSGNSYYSTVAARWAKYQCSIGSRLRRQAAGLIADSYDHLWMPLTRRAVWRKSVEPAHTLTNQICIPIAAFPVIGGMRGVLASVASVMQHRWRITYLTNHKGPEAEGLEIEEFGRSRIITPWRFPSLWLYCLVGGYKLLQLLRAGSDYRLLLPQDGVYSAAYTALVGKASGVRVVCMDHGNMECFVDSAFQKEYAAIIAKYPWYLSAFARLQSFCYCLSLRFLAQLATPLVDHFLIAGVETEEVYRNQFGVRASQITRYGYIVDMTHFELPDRKTRVSMRARQGISEDAIVISLIHRLSPEKGLSFAIEGVALALSELPLDLRTRVKVLVVGDGPLRKQIELDIQRYKLDSVCVLWGEAKPDEVTMLLAISDIFIYSGIRGANCSLSVLEAMAAGCAVVSSTVPQSHARLMADGRGISVRPANAQEIGAALIRLCCDQALCHDMGQRARAYVATYHSATRLERTLLRTSFFIPNLVKQDESASESIAIPQDQSIRQGFYESNI